MPFEFRSMKPRSETYVERERQRVSAAVRLVIAASRRAASHPYDPARDVRASDGYGLSMVRSILPRGSPPSHFDPQGSTPHKVPPR